MAVVVAGTIQGKAGKPGKAGKAGKTGPGQTKPRLGTTGKPAKPRQDLRARGVQGRPNGALPGEFSRLGLAWKPGY